VEGVYWVRIYKYQLSIQPGYQVLDLPASAKILKVDIQPSGKAIAFWAMVDVKNYLQLPRKFIVCATGYSEVDPDWIYLDTVFDTQYVWHVFEISKYDDNTKESIS
jgi:hypothetical protein